MAYRFAEGDVSVENAVRRIACEQLDRALTSLEAQGDARPPAVHDVRKRCKKLRGLIRLVRPSFPGYRDENAALRETAAMIGSFRDAKVLQDTYDVVMDGYTGRVSRRKIAPVRAALTRQRRAALAGADLDKRFADARANLVALRERAANWSLDDTGWKALEPGTTKIYKRARKAMERATNGGDSEQHHEWRKQLKYHWHHTRLLRVIQPDEMTQRAAMLQQLTGLLGDHHDCHVLERTIRSEPTAFASAAAVETLAELTRRRQKLLEQEAHRLGLILLVDKPTALADRWGEWWRARQHETDLRGADSAG